ncbi:hypothetical protein BGX38DRAFT_1075920, partial [Terfezia claveryi]
SHTPETMQYMSNYLQDFHKYRHVFGEFRTSQAIFNYSKLHLFTHYLQQVIQFRSLLQYSMEIIEAIYKPLKEAYKQSNRVDATVQIFDMHARDYAFKI